jgi:uncharacterized protein involved in oxidation of intracellular sulfur
METKLHKGAIIMRKASLFLTMAMLLSALSVHGQCDVSMPKTTQPTSIGIVVYSNDGETVWNAFRLANVSVSAGDTVSVFLLGKGVDLDSLGKKNSNVKEQTDTFMKSGGKILACGTCLRSRNISSPKACSISTMGALYDMIRKSKTVLTF